MIITIINNNLFSVQYIKIISIFHTIARNDWKLREERMKINVLEIVKRDKIPEKKQRLSFIHFFFYKLITIKKL